MRSKLFLLMVFKVLRQLNVAPETYLSFCDKKGEIEKAKKPWDFLPSGHKIGKPEPLFKELVRIIWCLDVAPFLLYSFCASINYCLQSAKNAHFYRKMKLWNSLGLNLLGVKLIEK